MTYGLYLNKLQGWAIQKLCNVEIRFISVERIFQYCCIPSEPPLEIESNRPHSFWPSHGKVDIINLQVITIFLLNVEREVRGAKSVKFVNRFDTPHTCRLC